eukprot:1144174-Pelagomonas_calceolata.AAC.7
MGALQGSPGRLLNTSGTLSVRAEEAVSHLESTAAVARSRTLSLEGALRVKEREIERLTRLSETAKDVPAPKAIHLFVVFWVTHKTQCELSDRTLANPAWIPAKQDRSYKTGVTIKKRPVVLIETCALCDDVCSFIVNRGLYGGVDTGLPGRSARLKQDL